HLAAQLFGLSGELFSLKGACSRYGKIQKPPLLTLKLHHRVFLQLGRSIISPSTSRRPARRCSMKLHNDFSIASPICFEATTASLALIARRALISPSSRAIAISCLCSCAV